MVMSRSATASPPAGNSDYLRMSAPARAYRSGSQWRRHREGCRVHPATALQIEGEFFIGLGQTQETAPSRRQPVPCAPAAGPRQGIAPGSRARLRPRIKPVAEVVAQRLPPRFRSGEAPSINPEPRPPVISLVSGSTSVRNSVDPRLVLPPMRVKTYHSDKKVNNLDENSAESAMLAGVVAALI